MLVLLSPQVPFRKEAIPTISGYYGAESGSPALAPSHGHSLYTKCWSNCEGHGLRKPLMLSQRLAQALVEASSRLCRNDTVSFAMHCGNNHFCSFPEGSAIAGMLEGCGNVSPLLTGLFQPKPISDPFCCHCFLVLRLMLNKNNLVLYVCCLES